MKKEHRTNRRYSAEFKIRAILTHSYAYQQGGGV